MYHCKLVHKGYVKQSFYREGDSVLDVLESLNMYDFGKGEWIVEDTSDDCED